MKIKGKAKEREKTKEGGRKERLKLEERYSDESVQEPTPARRIAIREISVIQSPSTRETNPSEGKSRA
jgi:hypothetical protein